MPTSARALVESVGCGIAGSVPWGAKPTSTQPGVYLVSLSPDPDDTQGLPRAPIDLEIVRNWIECVPALVMDGRRPSPPSLEERLAEYWLPDESILYIGKATCLRDRLAQYYSTPVGNRGPHAGGHWIKTLSILQDLTVYVAETPMGVKPEEIETSMLTAFIKGVSDDAKIGHRQPHMTSPFANLQARGYGTRNHGIRSSKLS